MILIQKSFYDWSCSLNEFIHVSLVLHISSLLSLDLTESIFSQLPIVESNVFRVLIKGVICSYLICENLFIDVVVVWLYLNVENLICFEFVEE